MDSRRDFIAKALALGALTGIQTSGLAGERMPSSAGLPSLKGRKVLFTYGGWDGHEPQKYADFLYPWLENEGANVVLNTTLNPYTDKALMDSIDLVIQI